MGKYRTTYTEAEVSAAVDKVRRKLLGVNEAARRFGVPKSTIRSRTKMNPRNVVRSGPQSILTTEEEDEIQKWIFDMQRRGFPVTQEMLMGTVQQILIAQPRKNPFKNNCPGKKWFKLFRQRHPEIAIRTPEFTTNASSKVSPEDIKGWYDGNAQDVDVDEQNPNETDSANRDDSGVSGLTLKDILTTPPTPKRKGTREYKSKKFHVLTSDEFIEEFTQKEQEKKRQEEAKENRKKEREQKKIENTLKKKIKSEEKAVRIKRKALSDKN